jgi:hypothetical protein
MTSVDFLKNKKMVLGIGLAFVVIVGFIAFKLLTGGGEAQTPPAPRRTAERSQPRSKPQSLAKKEGAKTDTLAQAKADTTQKLPGETPLYRLLKGWRDPFGNGNRRVAELEERIKIIKMEIELLRDSLEQEKLKEELAKLGRNYVPAPVSGSRPESYTKKSEPKKITVKAILISEDGKTALLYWGSKKAWVKEGELFGGWVVSEIGKDKVILTKEGISQILSYHPLPIYEGVRNE